MEYKEILLEVTGTADGFTYPEHTYYLNQAGKLAAFKSAFTGEFKEFTKPLAFYKTRRKFKKVKA